MSMTAVYLSEEDRITVEKFARNGTHNSHLVNRANILLVLQLFLFQLSTSRGAYHFYM